MLTIGCSAGWMGTIPHSFFREHATTVILYISGFHVNSAQIVEIMG